MFLTTHRLWDMYRVTFTDSTTYALQLLHVRCMYHIRRIFVCVCAVVLFAAVRHALVQSSQSTRMCVKYAINI